MPSTKPTAPTPPGTAPVADAPAASGSTTRLRSGTAARLAGVPVATLRVWERRYAVVAAPKTATGQRLYSPHDVMRLRLLRELTQDGHSIGTLAGLDLPSLQALASGLGARPAAPAVRRRLVVVGRAALQRVHGLADTDVLAAHDGLADAEAAASPLLDPAAAPGADLLLVQLSSLPPDAAERVDALRRRWQAPAVLLLYAFGAEATVARLRAAGVAVHREPLGAGEWLRLVSSAAPIVAPVAPATAEAPLAGQAAAAPYPLRSPATPRRYSDQALAVLADLPSAVACECPRHLAEIVQQLVAFERYSADCRSQHPADAELHHALQSIAATARTLFEDAVARVVAAEGLDLPAMPAGGAGS